MTEQDLLDVNGMLMEAKAFVLFAVVGENVTITTDTKALNNVERQAFVNLLDNIREYMPEEDLSVEPMNQGEPS